MSDYEQAYMQMQDLGTLGGVRYWWADTRFTQPGLYRWNPAGYNEKVWGLDSPENYAPERKPTPVEALAERLAKVEDRLAHTPTIDAVTRELNQVGAALEEIRRLTLKPATGDEGASLSERVDKVAEIIGERVSGLVDEIATLRDMFDRAETRTVNLFDRHSTDIASLLHPDEGVKQDGAAFPTGGARTAEAAADAVLPVPQRGDRVRLEGAVGKASGRRIKDGWYDVIGADSSEFQIKVPHDEHGVATPDWVPWLSNKTANLKEVRHAEQH